MLRTALGSAISAFLEDPAVVEVMLNPDGKLWVDRLSDGLADTRATLKISGRPSSAMASSNAAMQNSTSIVFDNRQANTRRAAQSITAAKYRPPRRIGI